LQKNFQKIPAFDIQRINHMKNRENSIPKKYAEGGGDAFRIP